jgi:hypothetical protein
MTHPFSPSSSPSSLSSTNVSYLNASNECESGHRLWIEQVQRLQESLTTLHNTDPCNIIEHFFTQAINTEFASESAEFQNTLKKLLSVSVRQKLDVNSRQHAADVLAQIYSHRLLNQIRLSDIRNHAVFQIYSKCGIAVDTYFERFSSPPGSSAQNTAYSKVAHGNAICNAETTKILSNVLTYFQFLKRVNVVKQQTIGHHAICSQSHLNWVGTMWLATIKEKSLSELIWELFLDLWSYNEAITCLN